MARCEICGRNARTIAREIGTCLACLRTRPEEALVRAAQAHAKSRQAFGLPVGPPRDQVGIPCDLCVNECRIPPGGMGYCGLRKNENGKLVGVSADRAKVSWYHDPLPTNCVADWVCPAGTGVAYPRFAYCDGPERGYDNLAVFFHACTFNCLFCQNWHFKYETLDPKLRTADELASAVEARTACVCYFGGDPTAQLPYALKASRLALESNKDRILRICWETNGSMNPRLLDEMIDHSLGSGGCIKFDLKAFDENLHIALTGISNRRTLENFRRVAKRVRERPVPPLLVASTLLVPGYVDEQEVVALARFIASLNPDIPYSLLGFHPQFFMADLPVTTKDHARRCLDAAQQAGLRRLNIGNLRLLA